MTGEWAPVCLCIVIIGDPKIYFGDITDNNACQYYKVNKSYTMSLCVQHEVSVHFLPVLHCQIYDVNSEISSCVENTRTQPLIWIFFRSFNTESFPTYFMFDSPLGQGWFVLTSRMIRLITSGTERKNLRSLLGSLRNDDGHGCNIGRKQ